MATPLRIPEAYRPGLEVILGLDDNTVSTVCTKLSSVPHDVPVSELASWLASKIDVISQDSAQHLISTLFSLYTLRANLETPTSELVNDITSAFINGVEENHRLQEDVKSRFKRNISKLLSIDSIAIRAKTADLQHADPLAAARRRGARVREEILHAEGGTWTADKVAQHLGITEQEVDEKRRQCRLLALPIGSHQYVFPAWQFNSDGVLPGLEKVIKAFTVPSAWTQAAFFLGENTYLGGARPIDELRRGNVEAVRRAAGSFGEQGAA